MKLEIEELLRKGTVIPAHPLALTSDLRLDEQVQRRLTRYYMASGAGGIAIGVHTTQFEIRRPEINLLEPVLRLAAEEIKEADIGRSFIKIAGICGPTAQAVTEAELAVKYGYDLGLVSLGGLNDYSEDALIRHIERIAEIIPVFGFYLQPAVGGLILSYSFWRRLAEIPNVKAIKTAPFNRYQTLDVIRAVCESSRNNEIAIYTGNDDNIVNDLLSCYEFNIGGKPVKKRVVGGLLGHWAVWTHHAVSLFEKVRNCVENDYAGIEDLLVMSGKVTDMNAALFNPQYHFKGSIAGLHEVLRRQGLLKGIRCLDKNEKLMEGQADQIDRICSYYPELTSSSFVDSFLKDDENRTI